MVSYCKVWSPSWTGTFKNRADVLYCISVLVFLFVAQILSRLVLSRCVHFYLMSCMWSLKLSEVSLVTSMIFVECLCGIAVLSSVSCGVCRCSFV